MANLPYTYDDKKTYLSKIQLGDNLYYVKDSQAQAVIESLGNAALKSVAAGVGASEDGLVTGAQVQSAIASLTGAMHFVGVKDSLPTSDNKDGDVVIVGTKEYVWSTDKWVELGDESIYALKSTTVAGYALSDNITVDQLQEALGLGALAYKDSATGTVAGQTIKGVKATGTSTGSIDVALTQTDTAASLTKENYQPEGEVSGKVTATGTVAIAKSEEGTQISGSVSTPKITVTPDTDSIKKVTSVGSLPTKAADTFTANGDDTFTQGSQVQWSAAVEDEVLSFSFVTNTLPTFTQGAKASFTEGAFDQGSLPTLAEEATTVVTGIASATSTQPEFTGDKFGATFTGNAAGDAINATFTGTVKENALVTGVNYDKASVDTANTKFNSAAIELAVGDITVATKEVTVQ